MAIDGGVAHRFGDIALVLRPIAAPVANDEETERPIGRFQSAKRDRGGGNGKAAQDGTAIGLHHGDFSP
jgi:hypothetical protein